MLFFRLVTCLKHKIIRCDMWIYILCLMHSVFIMPLICLGHIEKPKGEVFTVCIQSISPKGYNFFQYQNSYT